MKLLVGYDGSNSSKEALDLACKHAKVFDAAIEVVTSMERGTADDAKQIKQSEDELKWVNDFVQEKGIAVNTHLLIRGMKPGEDVVQFADENKVEAVYIGIRRRSAVGKLLFGSNAQYIILKAPCPVITVK